MINSFSIALVSLNLYFLSLPIAPPIRVVEWLTPMTHDFGEITHNKYARHTFKFRNISTQPIVIDNVRPACGCTAPDWPQTPIEPDSIGVINIRYDADNKGEFRKKITVYFSGQKKGDKLFVEGETIE